VGALAARYGFAASYGGGGGKEEEEEVRRRFASGVGSAVRVQGARMCKVPGESSVSVFDGNGVVTIGRVVV